MPNSSRDTRIQVLAVDDNELHLVLFTAVASRFENVGISVARNGFESLLRLSEARPHIMITELDMPHMDGFQMLRILAAERKYWPDHVIAVSGLEPEDIEARGACRREWMSLRRARPQRMRSKT